jgi:hypothetical protein
MKTILLLFTIIMLMTQLNRATTYTWTGNSSTNWATNNNWSPSTGYPSSTSDIAQFNSGATITVNLTASYVTGQLVLSNNTNVTLTGSSSTRTLTVGNSSAGGDDLNINAGSTLTISTNVDITMASSSTGNIAGTLIVNSSRTFDTDNTSVLTTVTGTIRNAGTVSGTAARLNFASGSKYQHNYTTSAGNIPTATWSDGSTCELIGYTSATNFNGNTTISQSFYNFVYNCTSQGAVEVSAASNLTTVRGNLTITSTGTGSFWLSRTTVVSTNISGNLQITNGTLGFATTGTGGAVTVSGNFTMDAGTLTMSAGTGNSTLNIAGNFSQNGGTITETSTGYGTIVFNSSSDQTFSAGGTISNTINFTVNKTGGNLILNSNLQIDGTATLALTQGNINLNNRTLTLGTSASSRGTLSWTSGFMVGAGNFTRWFSSSSAVTLGNVAGLFPMGDGSNNRNVWFGGTASSSGTISVQHSNQTGYTDITAFTDGSISINRRHNMNWTLTTANGFNDGNAELRIQGTGIPGITVVADLRMIRASDAVGTSSNGTGTASNPQVNRTGLSGAQLNNTFYFGSNSSLNPLATALLEAIVFLEGPYNTSTDEMTTSLNSFGYIQTESPYSEDLRTATVPSNVTDWVLVQLRSTANGTAVASRSAFLHKDGRIVADDGTTNRVDLTASAGNYYIVVKHRNHLAVMSSAAVTFSGSPSVTTYDFTTGSDKYYGTDGAKELEPGVWGMWAGDVNGDGILKYSDIDNDRLEILIRLGYIQTSTTTGYYNEDINMDGEVRYSDIDNDRLIILENLNYIQTSTRSTQVPN